MERDSSWTQIFNLPAEIEAKIFSCIPKPMIPQLRLVCKRWNNVIEGRVRMSVTVNDGIPDNIQMVKRIKTDCLNVGKLGHQLPKEVLRQSNAIEAIRVHGPIRYSTLREEFVQFRRLRELHFFGESLSKKLILTEELYFPCLEVLRCTITSNDEYHMIYGVKQQKQVTASTVKKLLTFISSPKLKSFTIDGCLNQVDLKDEYEWKKEVLLKFLERHKDTLTKLILGENCMLNSWKFCEEKFFPDIQARLPKKLRTIRFSTSNVSTNYSYDKNVWLELLKHQREAEFINLGCLYSNHTLAVVVTSLPVTLKSLTLFWNVQFGIIDLNYLAHLTNLEKLELTHDGKRIKNTINFNTLRCMKNLKTLILEHMMLNRAEVSLIPQYFKKLEHLHLYRVAFRFYEMEDVDLSELPDTGISLETLCAFLHMRTLNYLAVEIADITNACLEHTKCNLMYTSLRKIFTRTPGINIWRIGDENAIPDYTPSYDCLT